MEPAVKQLPIQRQARKKLKPVLYHLGVGGFALIMMYPVIWLIMSSFKETSLIFVTAKSLIPDPWVWVNYKLGWEGIGGIHFSVFIKNSLIIVVLATIGAVISSSLVAYGFARISFPGKRSGLRS